MAHHPFEINETVKIFDRHNRNNITARIIEQPTSENQLYLVEYVGSNQYDLTGQDRVLPSDIQKA
jgi:hypothetical protein